VFSRISRTKNNCYSDGSEIALEKLTTKPSLSKLVWHSKDSLEVESVESDDWRKKDRSEGDRSQILRYAICPNRLPKNAKREIPSRLPRPAGSARRSELKAT